jgi:hypothetical protein
MVVLVNRTALDCGPLRMTVFDPHQTALLTWFAVQVRFGSFVNFAAQK